MRFFRSLERRRRRLVFHSYSTFNFLQMNHEMKRKKKNNAIGRQEEIDFEWSQSTNRVVLQAHYTSTLRKKKKNRIIYRHLHKMCCKHTFDCTAAFETY